MRGRPEVPPPSARARARGPRAGELRLDLGQPGGVARHQECVVLVGEVAGVMLTFRIVERAAQEVALVGQEPAFVVDGASWPATAGDPSTRHDGARRAPRTGATGARRAGRPRHRRHPEHQRARGRSPGCRRCRAAPAGWTRRTRTRGSGRCPRSRPRGHHGLDLVAHRDGRGRVRVGHGDVGARRAAHTGLDRRRARCDVVWGAASSTPLPMTRATPRTTSGSATFTHSGRRPADSASGRPRRAQRAPRAGTCRGSARWPVRPARWPPGQTG